MVSNDAKPPTLLSADILIGGGGFVGLSLGLALAKLAPQGLRIVLVDGRAADAPIQDARASALSAASRNLLEAIGVWSELAPDAQAMTEIEITDAAPVARGPRLSLLDFDNELAPGKSGAFVLENAKLLRALGQAVAAEPAVHMIAPDQVTGFATDGFGITAQLRSGGEIRAALLVAADGRASRLRDMAGIKTVHWSYEQKGIVGTVAHEKPHGGKAVQHFLPAGPFARLPLTGNRSSIVWSEESHETDRIMALGDGDFLAELSRRFGTALGPLSLAGPHQAFPLSLHLARSFIAPRFALIGDSAHGVHPLAGQGLNIGFRDVAALTEVLVETARLGLDLGGTVPLERYERWRRFDSAISALAMDLMNRAFSNDVAGLRALRDQGLRLVNRVPQLKAFFVREAAGQTGDVPRLLQGKPL